VALCSRRPRAYTANGEKAEMAALGPGDLIAEVEVLTAGVRNDPQGMRIADPECLLRKRGLPMHLRLRAGLATRLRCCVRGGEGRSSGPAGWDCSIGLAPALNPRDPDVTGRHRLRSSRRHG
jgi:hypothetical protein